MSLRWRFLGAFILIVALSVVLSVGVGFYTTRGRFDTFIGELGSDEASHLAQNLSQEYTASDGWDSFAEALSGGGYLYGEEGDEGDEGSEEASERFHRDPIRVVIVDVEGFVVHDNFSELAPGGAVPELAGQRTTIFDLRSNQPVGYAFVDVNREFLATESQGLLRGILYTTTIGGLLSAVVAILLAVWLSWRITAPVTALMQATQAIVQHGDSALLPVGAPDELGQMSAAFNQMTAALQTQRDLRQRLIDDVTHELNTPLSVIQLEAHGLRKGLQAPSQAADHIIQEIDMLRNLVRDLNWLAETDSGELRLDREPYLIHDLLTTEVERWQPQAQAHQVALSLELLPALPVLELDPMRMSQVLGNVVHNALQHVEAGGRVTVAASEETGGGVVITVTDDGMGIDPADLPQLFDRFYHTDQSRSRGTGGRGLGLAIARAIVEAHQGTIAVTSDGPGQGTTVRFDLPKR